MSLTINFDILHSGAQTSTLVADDEFTEERTRSGTATCRTEPGQDRGRARATYAEPVRAIWEKHDKQVHRTDR